MEKSPCKFPLQSTNMKTLYSFLSLGLYFSARQRFPYMTPDNVVVISLPVVPYWLDRAYNAYFMSFSLFLWRIMPSLTHVHIFVEGPTHSHTIQAPCLCCHILSLSLFLFFFLAYFLLFEWALRSLLSRV